MLQSNSSDFAADPQVVGLEPVLENARAFAKGLVIKTAEQYQQAANQLKSIKGSLATIEDARTRITKPLNETLREVNAQAKAAAEPFVNGEIFIKRAMIVYSDEQDRIRREEQRRVNEAAEKERLRLQKIADAARAKGNEEKAEQFEERAAVVVAPVAQQAAPKVAGVTMSTVWDFEIVDDALIPRSHLTVNESSIRGVVRAMKGNTNIPGIRVFERKQVGSTRS